MPKTLVCCPPRLDRRALRGFTLVELVVVLALVAMATGLVAPAVMRGVDAARERGARADIRVLLEGMPVRAYQGGAVLEMDATALRRLVPELPEAWRIEVDPPLRYAPNGVAAGGVVRLLIPDREPSVWKIATVSGQVEVVPARAALR
jgi:prepilin-type N-terminal cleavage/methylation domain-containing protein